MSNVSIHSRKSASSGYEKEIEGFLRTDFGLDEATCIPFSCGKHWISTPLKVVGRTGEEEQLYAAKVITAEGLNVHQRIITNKNARFVRNGVFDIAFDGSASAYELLQLEARFLRKAKRANISVPTPLEVLKLTAGAALIMEFIEGVPLERVKISEHALNAVFRLIKQLRGRKLVHGDVRRDNFIMTGEHELCVIDYLHLAGDIKRALDYDMTSALCHLSLSVGPAIVLEAARAYLSTAELRGAVPFVNFITQRLTNRDRAQILQTILA
jgi:hypothetical protein